MRKSNAGPIPLELRHKVSPGLLVFVDERRAVKGLGILWAVWGLYGPVVRHPDHNGFLLLFAPWICPAVWALFSSSIPHRPYRGQLYGGLHDVDASDPAVMRLLEIYQSEEARRYLWRESLELSAILFVILGTATFCLRDSLNWILPSSRNGFLLGPGHWFWIGLTLCFIGSLLTLEGGRIRWILLTWATREAAHHSIEETKQAAHSVKRAAEFTNR